MTDLPLPSSQQTMTPGPATLNRHGTVQFSSDRPDLQGRSVQLVHRENRTLEVWTVETSKPSDWQLPWKLKPQPTSARVKAYELAQATVSYESGQGAVRRTPAWAIVLAIVLFPIGLLFLLAKKTTYWRINQAQFIDPQGRSLLVAIQ